MGDDQGHVRVRILRVREQRGHQILARVLAIADHQHPAAAEQRRAEHLGDLARGEQAGFVLPDVRTGVRLPGRVDGRGDRAGGQQFLVALDEQQRGGRCGVHAQHRRTVHAGVSTAHSFASRSTHGTRNQTYRRTAMRPEP
jgi:hypothetical protein